MTDKVTFERARHEHLYVRDLQPHPKAQRSFRLKWAKEIAAKFDPDLFGELGVAEYKGKYLVFRGQHRLAAAREVLGGDQKVPCEVWPNLDEKASAEKFLGDAHRLNVRAMDTWRMHILAEHEQETRLDNLLKRHKLTAGEGSGNGIVRAVAAVTDVDARYGEPVLDRTLTILGRAWGGTQEAYDAAVLRGLGLVLHRFDGEVDDGELVKKLARGGGPYRLVGQARDYAKAAGVSVTRGMAEKIVNIYNKGRRTRLLDLSNRTTTAKKVKRSAVV